ncbi:MAG: VOC family protein [Acidimicrobiales bacterium]
MSGTPYPLPVEGTIPSWAGLNHLALVTDDMDRTTRFWHGVLGARLVATVATESFRHYFFDTGRDSCVAFFEYRGVEAPTLAKPAGVPDPRMGQFDHLSLNFPDEAAVLELRIRLEDHGTEVTEVVDHGFLCSIYFTDPNGIALEASWWRDDPTGGGSGSRHFTDPDPVPAVAEIIGGALATVSTRLVDGPTGDLTEVWSTGPRE